MMILSLIGFFLLLQFTWVFQFNALAYLFAFIFGALDSGFSNHIQQICGFEFGAKSAEAMGVYFTVKCLFIALTITLASLVSDR